MSPSLLPVAAKNIRYNYENAVIDIKRNHATKKRNHSTTASGPSTLKLSTDMLTNMC
jgi:hypothetical protein